MEGHPVRLPSVHVGIIISLLPLLIGCGKAKGPRGVIALYVVEHAASAPIIDGVLEDDCWKNVPALEFVRAEGGGKPLQQTSLRMLRDNENLYLAFECQDRDAASNVMEYDGPVEDQDCVALLIDAGADTTGYFMIAVAPTGAVHDAYILNAGNGAKVKTLSCWNCEKLRASVSVYGGGAQPGNEDRFWTVEMAVPFSQIITAPRIPPMRGDSWRVNFCRVDITGGRELTAAAPTGAPDMHRPYAFANIVFGDAHGAGEKSPRKAAGGKRFLASGGRPVRP